MSRAQHLIYESRWLRVTCTVGDPARAGEAVDLVTFEPWRARNQAMPFGRGFASKYGLNAVHVLPAGDDWYQYSDLPDALAAVARHVGPRTLGYGSSMGGYAVTTYGDLAGLRRALALSPQFTIHREWVPFERRWAEDAARIVFRADHARVADIPYVAMLFDPRNPDAEHVRLIAEAAVGEAVCIRVPGGGHPVGPVLSEAGILSRLVLGLLRDEKFPPGIEAELAGALEGSPRYHYVRALQSAGEQRGLHLLQGLAVAPNDFRLRHAWARYLWELGRCEDALAEMRWVVARVPNHPAYARQLRNLEAAWGRRSPAPAAPGPQENGSPALDPR